MLCRSRLITLCACLPAACAADTKCRNALTAVTLNGAAVKTVNYTTVTDKGVVRAPGTT